MLAGLGGGGGGGLGEAVAALGLASSGRGGCGGGGGGGVAGTRGTRSRVSPMIGRCIASFLSSAVHAGVAKDKNPCRRWCTVVCSSSVAVA